MSPGYTKMRSSSQWVWEGVARRLARRLAMGRHSFLFYFFVSLLACSSSTSLLFPLKLLSLRGQAFGRKELFNEIQGTRPTTNNTHKKKCGNETNNKESIEQQRDGMAGGRKVLECSVDALFDGEGRCGPTKQRRTNERTELNRRDTRPN